ncbi:MAG TPA: hypothetical protein VGN23_02425 [Verrucomicrobiae bacterium]|jgi:low affinity Fe/Cu permease
MNALGYNSLRQKAGHVCVDAIGRMATFMLVAVLVMAWVLTGPLFQMASHWSESWKRKKIAKGEL